MNSFSITFLQKTTILVSIFLQITIGLHAQSTNHNYILSKTMLNDAGTVSLDKIDYFDGLGRPAQTVLRNATPGGKDIVTLQEYDAVGRPSLSYLAVPVLSSSGAYVAPSTIKTRANSFYSDTRTFKESIYESSPLNRVEKVYGPGAAWHSNDKAITTTRYTNTSTGGLSCALYGVATDSSIKRTGLYSSGELYVTKTTGEDGHVSYTFTDKLGQTVLERVMNGSVMNDTYYVYDDLGNLRYVLPPSASDMLTATTTWADDNETLKNYAYIYKYDGRNRCTQKRLPGCEPIEMRYDKTDRMIFSQDGNQRSNGEWSFHLYDVLGRQTVTGVWVSATVPDISNTVVSSSYDPTGTKLGGYTVNLDPLPTTVKLMTVSYYDNYSFTSGVPQLDYVIPPVGYDVRFDNAKGLLTGSRTYLLSDPTKYTVSTLFYDHRGRVVQTHASNSLGGFDDEYFAYTFTGKVKQRRQVHSAPGKTTQTETYTYDYGTPETNPAERLLSVSHKLNSTSAVTLAQYSYDEVGRVKTKKLGSETSTYSYNVRSWVEQIEGSKFNQTLVYNQSINGITPTKALYNGNISAMKWKAGNETTERGYKFNYDNLSRLTDANYGEGASIASNLNRFNEKLSYDKMGNIMTLQRRGKVTSSTYNLIDNLTYTYTGNQLTKVTDAVTTPITNESTLHFVDGANVDNEYVYDANGNLIKDLNKNITLITYNVLNLPKVITFGNANTITYTYGGSGNKLSVAYTAGGNTVKTDYVANKVYKNGTLSMMHTEEGYITFSGAAPTYHYYLKDHQGNNRVVINQSGTVEQVNHYYPFGGLFGEGLQTSNQPYKYNGKELDRFEGLDMFDYGFRFYDAALGRWGTMDPLAEKYYSISSYVYVANNPVNLIDPDGMAWRPTYDDDHDGNRTYNGYEWVDEDKSYDKNGNLLAGLYHQAIFFSDNGSFDSGKDKNIGSATATVYLADGTTQTFGASTNPSKPDYATVPEGIYHARVGKHKGQYTALRMGDIDNSGRIELGGANPAYPERTYAEGINIHKPGSGNLTGIDSKGRAISAGCLLIDINRWSDFIGVFDTHTQRSNTVSVVVSRSMSTPVNANRLPAFNFIMNGTRHSFFSPFK